MRRSGSGNLEELPDGADFKRGGVRSTAGPRLGWSAAPEQQATPPDSPFAQWDNEQVCVWLEQLGLEQYVQEAKRWARGGQHLQQAQPQEIEKELQLKNQLHRKKLLLALVDVRDPPQTDDELLAEAGQLDTGWVIIYVFNIYCRARYTTR